jgi:hypothetical protein
MTGGSVERKKLIRRAALVGLALLLASGLIALVAHLSLESRWERHQANRDDHVAKLTQEYQAYLDETAQKIKGLPADPRVIGEIQTRHYQERPAHWLYVWASTNSGEFAFGVPPDAFARLNTAFDQLQPVITQDNFYAGRDQFLRTLLHTRRTILVSPKTPGEDDWWRFYREDRDDDRWDRFHRTNSLFLSSPIQTAAGATVGNLNLKLVDEKDAPLYWSRRHLEENQASYVVLPVALAVGVLSLIWLWFLLPSWVYIDARERGVPRPLLWAVLTLLGNVFALMVYLVSRPTDVQELRCPKCAKALNGSKAGCPYCGADLSTAFCPQCQYPLKPDWTFCPSCRTSIAKTPAA